MEQGLVWGVRGDRVLRGIKHLAHQTSCTAETLWLQGPPCPGLTPRIGTAAVRRDKELQSFPAHSGIKDDGNIWWWIQGCRSHEGADEPSRSREK